MRKRSRFAGISGTLIIHLALLLPFIIIPILHPPVSNVPKSTEKVLEVTLLPPKESLAEKLPISDIPNQNISQTDPVICKNQDKNYFGVGFIYSPFTSLVTYAPEFYPAYKAGIRIGDMVLDPDTPIVNGFLDIEIIRGYQQMHFRIKAENICFKTS
jgi:hypothetical protein